MKFTNIEYIEKYWRNELNENERQAFEQRCAEEDTFAKEVALYLHLKEIAKEEQKANLKNQYKQQERRRLIIKITTITIGLLGLIFLFLKFFPSNQTTVEPEMIFAELVKENDSVRSNNNAVSVSLSNCLILDLTSIENINCFKLVIQDNHEKGKYRKNINRINAFFKVNPDVVASKDKLLWWQSLAFWKLGEIEKAQINWETIVKEDYKFMRQEAELLLKQF